MWQVGVPTAQVFTFFIISIKPSGINICVLFQPNGTVISSCHFSLDCINSEILHEIKIAIALWAKSGRKGWAWLLLALGLIPRNRLAGKTFASLGGQGKYLKEAILGRERILNSLPASVTAYVSASYYRYMQKRILENGRYWPKIERCQSLREAIEGGQTRSGQTGRWWWKAVSTKLPGCKTRRNCAKFTTHSGQNFPFGWLSIGRGAFFW